MSLTDYLNLSNPEVSSQYEGKFIVAYDELPGVDNFNYIENLVGYELECVHLNSDSKYFRYSKQYNQLYEEPILNDLRHQINSYVLDITKSNYAEGLSLNHGDKFLRLNVC